MSGGAGNVFAFSYLEYGILFYSEIFMAVMITQLIFFDIKRIRPEQGSTE